MKELLAYADVMARSGVPILITGESGTGKELLARGIHRASGRAGGPLVAVNIASIPATLFESQVFGHVAGSFTGASAEHIGYFEQANGGTLFLDEVGELPTNLQVKLLRVLEEKTITRIGATKQIGINVRVIAATNQDLDVACKNGFFRLDLLYRLKAAHIRLPPLRERTGDIAVLANYFLRQARARHGKDVAEFSPEAMAALMQKEFPGNIRELAQIVEHAVLIARSTVIQPEDLGGRESRAQTQTLARTLSSLKEDSDKHLAYVLLHAGGDRQRAAEILGVTLRQVQRRLSQIKRRPEWKGLLGDI
jgi:transcriptional regulator with PAS, ATPase and Fis domain